MDAKELRLNNIVLDKNNNIRRICGINELGIDMLCLKCEKSSFNELTKNIYPILLTEEWLLKLGFQKFKHKWSLSDGGLNEHWELDGNDRHFLLYFLSNGVFAFNEPILYRECFSHNKYVHQLQNLYYALTNKELDYESQTNVK